MYEALVNYIEKALSGGTSPRELKVWLLKHGYTEQSLRETLGGQYLEYFHERNLEIYLDTLLFCIGVPLVLLSSLFFLHSFQLKIPVYTDYILIAVLGMLIGLIMTDLYTRRPVSDPQLIICIFITALISAVIPSTALYYQRLYDLSMLNIGGYGINVDVFEITPMPVLISITIFISLCVPFLIFLLKRSQISSKE